MGFMTPRVRRGPGLNLPPEQRNEQPPPRTRLFAVWQAVSAGAKPFELSNLLDIAPNSLGGSRSLDKVTPITPARCTTACSTLSSIAASTQAVSTVSKTATVLSAGLEGDNFINRRWVSQLAEANDYTDKFKALCKRKYGSMIRAWRLLLDVNGIGRVCFNQFCHAAREMGYKKVSMLWSVLDADGSKFITLDTWDPDSYRVLMEFRQICYHEFGGVETAFKYGLDRDGSGTCKKHELESFLDYQEFTGDFELLWGALDQDACGFITIDELDFLAKWTGKRFTSTAMDRDFKFGLPRLKRAQDRRRREFQKRALELERQVKEKQAVHEKRVSRLEEKQQADHSYRNSLRGSTIENLEKEAFLAQLQRGMTNKTDKYSFDSEDEDNGSSHAASERPRDGSPFKPDDWLRQDSGRSSS